MSAAVAWDLAPARAPVPPSRPPLALVPTGDAVRWSRRRLRLTRAGRLAVTITVSAVALVAAIALFSGRGTAPMDHATTVRPGQTLSEVAQEQLPRLDIHEAVVRIQLANNLPSSQVKAGQSLLIPSAG